MQALPSPISGHYWVPAPTPTQGPRGTYVKVEAFQGTLFHATDNLPLNSGDGFELVPTPLWFTTERTGAETDRHFILTCSIEEPLLLITLPRVNKQHSIDQAIANARILGADGIWLKSDDTSAHDMIAITDVSSIHVIDFETAACK